METAQKTPLHQYVELEETFFAGYEIYQPDAATIDKVRDRQPSAHVITPSRYSCRDCARNLPQMARIAELLPGWTWEVFDSITNEVCMTQLKITHIPTFIVYDQEGGNELGRIIENPESGSLEIDLLRIVSG